VSKFAAGPAITLQPYLLALAALSVGAAAIHFAVVFEHFDEYTLYGVLFLVISQARRQPQALREGPGRRSPRAYLRTEDQRRIAPAVQRLQPSYQGLNPHDPSSLVYAINAPHHSPILLGAMYIMGGARNGAQIGRGMTRWHSHWSRASMAARPSPGSVSTSGTAVIRPRGTTGTRRRCCTYGSSPILAASSPTT
jgi:hypothetical protein